ncbi:MAG TPA: rhodanese-like domain-containing protein, partial [Saprospiraceae bacterium]|nr:rhodanese-like domain-containing protein [Saprospiraceae bacterium]
MKKTLLLLLSFYLYACNGGVNSKNRVDAEGLIRMAKADSTVQIVDVRTPEEWMETGRIAGAIPIDYNAQDFDARLSQLNKEKPVIVYCNAGSRSTKAAEEMRELGFK